MVIRSFQDADTASFFKNGRIPSKKGWAKFWKVVQRKLDMLHYAKELNDLRSPPGNRLESLCGNLKGYLAFASMINGGLYLDGIINLMMFK